MCMNEWFIDLQKRQTVNVTHTKRNDSDKSIGITPKANQSLHLGSAHFKQFKQLTFSVEATKENKTQEEEEVFL